MEWLVSQLGKLSLLTAFVLSVNTSEASLYDKAARDQEGFWARQARELPTV
mgnify:CR=1 FL=1|jgi:hypothetical protein